MSSINTFGSSSRLNTRMTVRTSSGSGLSRLNNPPSSNPSWPASQPERATAAARIASVSTENRYHGTTVSSASDS